MHSTLWDMACTQLPCVMGLPITNEHRWTRRPDEDSDSSWTIHCGDCISLMSSDHSFTQQVVSGHGVPGNVLGSSRKLKTKFILQWSGDEKQGTHCAGCAVISVRSSSAILWAVAPQAPLSMGFSTQGYWSGLPCPPPDLHNRGVKPDSYISCIGRRVLYH